MCLAVLAVHGSMATPVPQAQVELCSHQSMLQILGCSPVEFLFKRKEVLK